MSDTLGWLSFSNAPFRWVKRIWFHRWVLWPVVGATAVGLPLALVGVAIDRTGFVLAGVLITLPFQLWAALLAVVSLILAVPRLLVLGVGLVAVYFGWSGLAKRLADWTAKYEATPNKSQQQTGPA